MTKKASKKALRELREKLVPIHECGSVHYETVIHENEEHCHHYKCPTKGCNIKMGINLSGPRVKFHKWTEE